MTRPAPIALSAWLALAACGGLESPDLATGTVTGRVTSWQPGAYVYAFGRPDLRSALATDGGFDLAGVPVETAAVVVVDGPALDLTRRAEIVTVTVLGAERTDVGAIDASRMPLASTVVAVAQAAGGARPDRPVFSLAGTERENVTAAVDVAALDPIPAGSFQLSASMHGFHDASLNVTVGAGQTVPFTLRLEPDPASDAPGCRATGCRNAALQCGTDGSCYACLAAQDCVSSHGAGWSCDTVVHLCSPAASAAGGTCDACTSGAQCAGGTCVPSGTGGTSGYCSRSCSTASECPAGFGCQGGACVAPGGCAAYFDSFGDACLGDAACLPAGGKCKGAFVGPAPVAGYCTVGCATAADCLAPGYPNCDAATNLCAR